MPDEPFVIIEPERDPETEAELHAEFGAILDDIADYVAARLGAQTVRDRSIPNRERPTFTLVRGDDDAS
jgi:hypothetical protein